MACIGCSSANSSPSCFYLHKLSARQYLSHTFSQEFHSFSKWGPFLLSLSLAGLAGLWFWALGGLSSTFCLRNSYAAFLFHVAETKLFQFILGRIHFTFSSSWKSQPGLPANGGISTSRDGTWHASMQEGPQNNLPSWSRSYEIVKVKGSKALLPVVEPRAEASQMWPFQASSPQYISFRSLSIVLPWKFSRFEWGQLFAIEVRIRTHTFQELEVCCFENRPTRRQTRV